MCNNDTFGRLAFYLRFHEDTELQRQDRRELEDWYPLSSDKSPKVLADLFEAYAGAVYIQHGWKKLRRWLDGLLEPVVKAATGDYWVSSTPQQMFGPPSRPGGQHKYTPETRNQKDLLDYVERKKELFKTSGRAVVKMLPKSTGFRFDRNGWLEEPDCARLEVAVHLINMWISDIVADLWPEYHHATARAARFLSVRTFFFAASPSLMLILHRK